METGISSCDGPLGSYADFLHNRDDLIFISGDLENILKKLSLEKYQPIFEEQEVNKKTV